MAANELGKYRLTVVLGPTASGKTRYAVRLAGEAGAEIISADSRQIYRGMDIGTGKDLGEYVYEGRPVSGISRRRTMISSPAAVR